MASTVFSPFTLRGMTIKNRIVMSPMLMYRGQDDGMINDFIYAHYAARALGGAGMIGTEVIAIEPRGRISANDLGLWNDAQAEALKRLTGFVHSCDTRIFAQLAHAGRKSHITETAIAPSAIAYDNTLGTPRAATAEDIASIIANYRSAACRAVEAGFDAVELHAANGYLLHEFLAPVSNTRDDAYGGSLENRMRLPLEVVEAVRSVIPEDMPLFYRIVASDFGTNGVTPEEALTLAAELKARGVDLIDVQTGNILPGYEGPVYPGYQTPYATRIKAATGLPMGATGSIASIDLAEFILSSGQADLVMMGRALLRDPFWPIRAAREAGIDVEVPIPTYARATGPFERGF
ncbi:NADH:flavin oxidoreductase/NADH oxidase [Pseudodonghicola flavimaris]|uniref:NADH:flavin oxidoreductase/NADH oxidase n=1 Tax=Pseudodonghicola flavimaris TaxID=3050036 RepID=A0ABT7F0P8_9RHOB|nr:NADH:flavin oxidoreductase/NADH oxidase [Pseudodonghicola flavimaris]MDK3018059.1 NADH:flavin oxidoreductase/NADH oxidase [Pseudodonghicola flavimaris]